MLYYPLTNQSDSEDLRTYINHKLLQISRDSDTIFKLNIFKKRID